MKAHVLFAIFLFCLTDLTAQNSNEIILWNVQTVEVTESGLLIQEPSMAIKIVDQYIDTIYDITDGFDCKKEDNCFDLEGRYVIPGLIDAHVHLTADYATKTPDIKDCEIVNQLLARYLKSGITTVVDLGMSNFVESCIDSASFSPRVIHSGQYIGEAGKTNCHLSYAICPNTIEEAIKIVKESHKKGRQIVKIREIDANSPIRNVIINEARELDMLVIEHQHDWSERLKIFKDQNILRPNAFAHAPPDILTSSKSNALFPYNYRDTAKIVIDSMYNNNVNFISTLLVQKEKKGIEDGVAILKLADENDLKFVLGTDAGIRPEHGSGFFSEFDFIAKHLSWKDAFEASTVSAAKLLRMAKLLGGLQNGKLADLVILNRADGRKIDIKESCMVIKSGKIVYQSEDCNIN